MKKLLALLLALSLLAGTTLSLASCGMRVHATNYADDYRRTATDGGVMTDEARAAAANFAMRLACAAKNEDNLALSPMSALYCLAMVAGGAAGDTLAELEAAFGIDEDTLDRALYAFRTNLASAEGCKLSLADSIWFADDGRFTVYPEFLQKNADWYGADVYGTAFDRETVRDINAWVQEKTDGMIKEIVDDRDVGANALMILVNTLLFDAEWAEKYEKSDIRDGTFTNADGTTSSVKMLSSTEGTYLAGDGYTGVMKYYRDGKYAFVGLLPDEGRSTGELLASLSGDAYLAMLSGASHESVRTQIPEFSLAADTELTDILPSLGVSRMFSPTEADFSRLGDAGERNIYCSYVKQKVRIDVDANGTKAAAVTWAGMKAESAGPEHEPKAVILDRPFVWAVVDCATGLPLFLGTVDTFQ